MQGLHTQEAGTVVTWRGVEDPEANLDELIAGYFNDERILGAKVAAERARRRGEPVLPVPEGYDGRLFDWLTEMLNYGPVDGPQRAWPVILALIERAPDGNASVFIGCGALEDLVNKSGVAFEDRIVAQATSDTRFRAALGCAWPDDGVPDDLRSLIRDLPCGSDPFPKAPTW